MIRVNDIEIDNVRFNGTSLEKVMVGDTVVFAVGEGGEGGGEEVVEFDAYLADDGSRGRDVTGSARIPVRIVGASAQDVTCQFTSTDGTNAKNFMGYYRVDDDYLLYTKNVAWEGGGGASGTNYYYSSTAMNIGYQGENKQLVFSTALNEGQIVLWSGQAKYNTNRVPSGGGTFEQTLYLYPEKYNSSLYYDQPTVQFYDEAQSKYVDIPLTKGVDYNATALTGGVITNIRLESVGGVGSLAWILTYSVSRNNSNKCRFAILKCASLPLYILQESETKYRVRYYNKSMSANEQTMQNTHSRVIDMSSGEYVLQPTGMNLKFLVVKSSLLEECDVIFLDSSSEELLHTKQTFSWGGDEYTMLTVPSIATKALFRRK